MNRRVLVYTNQLLPISNTFVLNQTIHLRRYTAYLLGSKRCEGLHIPIPEDRICLINKGSLRGIIDEFTFKFLGLLPARVSTWVSSVRPSLIHAHFGPSGAVMLSVARRLGLPLVVSFHGTDATTSDLYVWLSSYTTHRLYLLRRRELAALSDAVIVPSTFVRDVLVSRHGFPERKVVVIRHGVDLNEFRPGTVKSEWGHILYVGRLIELKGLPYLLEAIYQLKQKFSAIHLTVIGDGPKRAQYEAMAVKLLGSNVTFLGSQPPQVVRAYLERSYLFCMPSVTMPSGAAESFGMVFLEAMAMKVPPISFNVGGIPEVVKHGQTGFLAKERDVQGLTHYLKLLLENRELRERMGEAGRKWVEQEFDLEAQNDKLESLYDEIVLRGKCEHEYGN